MKIGELARLTHCKVETIRYYEQCGLLAEPDRSAGNYRDYEVRHVERLGFLRNCRHLDMSHLEIKTMLDCLDKTPSDCSAINQTIAEHLCHVRQRIAGLRELEKQLSMLHTRCRSAQSSQDCGIRQELIAAPSNMIDMGRGCF